MIQLYLEEKQHKLSTQDKKKDRPMTFSYFINTMEKFPWLIESSEIIVERKLKSGAFGEVFSGNYNDVPCALKSIPITISMRPNEFNRIVAELDVLRCTLFINILFYSFSLFIEILCFIFVNQIIQGQL